MIAFLDIYPREMKTHVHTQVCTLMFIPVLFITAKLESNQDVLQKTVNVQMN